MFSYLKKILLPVGVLLFLGFILFLINQISGIYLLLADFHELTAKIVLVGLIALCSGLLLTPFLLFFNLPQPLEKPQNKSEVDRYQRNLVKRLGSND